MCKFLKKIVFIWVKYFFGDILSNLRHVVAITSVKHFFFRNIFYLKQTLTRGNVKLHSAQHDRQFINIYQYSDI